MTTHAQPDRRILTPPPRPGAAFDVPSDSSLDDHAPYRPVRRHWPGVVAALAVAGLVAWLAVDSVNGTDTADTVTTPRTAPAAEVEGAKANGDNPTLPPGGTDPAQAEPHDGGVIVSDQPPVDVSSPATDDQPLTR
ncbi:hypothetical protein AACH06_27600 [Ideonella sp. DXS29W]|uniref:SPOR domain-containing protein n=1 Tax=Ideonella lacteola TaxID=2984193 RepID=A0ABU9BX90_9BURK